MKKLIAAAALALATTGAAQAACYAEYKAKRDSDRLGAPVLHVMREGWYERQRKSSVAAGKRAFQQKTELLSATKADSVMVRPELDDVIEIDVSSANE